MSVPRCRPLWRALLISLLIHALLLVGVARLIPSWPERSSSTLKVVVGSVRSPVGSGQPAAQERRPKSSPASAAAPAARRTAAEPFVQASSSPVLAPLPASTPAGQASVGAALSVHPEPVASSGAGTGRGDAAAVSVTAGASAEDLRQYRVSLASAARRFKRYPPLARERGWEGSAEVSVSLLGRFSVPEVSLSRSSGHRLLDDQALDMVAQAVKATELPEGLRGRELRLVLPVRFSLENDQ